MSLQKKSSIYLSEFLVYLAEKVSNGEEQLPSLSSLSKELNISVATLREQLEVARVFGLVEVRPKTGIKMASISLCTLYIGVCWIRCESYALFF